MIGRYRVHNNIVSDTWAELDDYIMRAMEYIRAAQTYTETELLRKHEAEFFRTLRRVEMMHKEKRQQAEERKIALEAKRRNDRSRRGPK